MFLLIDVVDRDVSCCTDCLELQLHFSPLSPLSLSFSPFNTILFAGREASEHKSNSISLCLVYPVLLFAILPDPIHGLGNESLHPHDNETY